MSLIARPANRKRWVSLTPLIDVVFILIMFFLLTTQFERTQVLDMSVAGVGVSATDAVSANDIARVVVLNDGEWQFNNLNYAFNDKAGLEELREFNAVHLTASKSVTLQDVIKFIDGLAQAGIDQVLWLPLENTDAR